MKSAVATICSASHARCFNVVFVISAIFLSLLPTMTEAADISTGDLYALIVGVSKYRHPKIKQLTVSDKDARDVAEFLRGQDKLFRKINVTLLTNEQATKAEIEKSLHYRLREAGKDDTVVIFWSGHGSDDPRLPGEFFFVTYDADPDYMTSTCVNMNQNRLLNRLDSKRVVLIADTCYAGNFTSMGVKSLRPALENFIRDFSESRGRVFLTSSRPDELSMEKPGLSNSVFTHYLLQGLRGEADTDKDGIVSIKELYDYVYQKTKHETNNVQHPQWEARLEGTFPLALSRSHASHKILEKLKTYNAPSPPVTDKQAVKDLEQARMKYYKTPEEALAYDVWRILTKDLDLSQLNHNTVTERDAVRAFEIYQTKHYGKIAGFRPWTHWNFMRSLSTGDLEILATEIVEYMRTHGVWNHVGEDAKR